MLGENIYLNVHKGLMQMDFSDFKNIAQVQQKYQIKYQEEHFMANQTSEISKPFLDDFNFCRKHIDIFSSEASRCELIISPLLREVYKHHYLNYSFWIHKYIKYDETLFGAPNYLFSGKSELGKTVLEKPLLVVVEAKKNDFEQGWGQCLAELQRTRQNRLDSVLESFTINKLYFAPP